MSGNEHHLARTQAFAEGTVRSSSGKSRRTGSDRSSGGSWGLRRKDEGGVRPRSHGDSKARPPLRKVWDCDRRRRRGELGELCELWRGHGSIIESTGAAYYLTGRSRAYRTRRAAVEVHQVHRVHRFTCEASRRRQPTPSALRRSGVGERPVADLPPLAQVGALQFMMEMA